MGRILVSASHYDDLCKSAYDYLISEGHEVIFDPSRSFPSYTESELKELLPGIDAAIIGMDKYTESVFSCTKRLKAVAKFGVGVDNIDLEAAKKHGVYVINAPGCNSNAVAELAVGFMIDLAREISPLFEDMREGGWKRSIGDELSGKTVGLLGFGAVARLVAKKLKAFDMNVIAYDLYPREDLAKELGVRLTTFDEVVENSDFLSLHIPATRENHHLFDGKMFLRMKKGSYFINTARGGLVDMTALVEVLKSGWLKGAGLDAFETEPLSKDDPIFSAGNVICTPHTGAETRESYEKVSLSTARDVNAVLKGGQPKAWVNRWE